MSAAGARTLLSFWRVEPLTIPPNVAVDLGGVDGPGVVVGFGMRCNWHGIWFGWTLDGQPVIPVNNIACLADMGLIGAAGAGMPAWCPEYRGPGRATVAFRYRLPFKKSMRLVLGTGSDDTGTHTAKGIHVYFEGNPGEVTFVSHLLEQASWVWNEQRALWSAALVQEVSP